MEIVLSHHSQSCFIDSDGLQILEVPFEFVRTSLKTIGVYMTCDMLTRPWGAGEISNALQIVFTETAPWQESPQSACKDIASYLDRPWYSITFDNAAMAYQHIIGSNVRNIVISKCARGRNKFWELVGT